MKSFFNHLGIIFDRHFSKGLLHQILWLIGIMVIVYAVLTSLSYVEFLYSASTEDVPHWYDRYRDILFVLIDPGSGSESMSSTFSIICALFGLIIFSGMLISVISNVLERRVERYQNGETNYNLHNHIVILGFDESIPSLLREIRKTHSGYTILMSEAETTIVRDWVHARLDNNTEKDIENHLIIMNGVRNADDNLDRLCLSNGVKEIYIIGESNEETHDSKSMDCVRMISEKLPQVCNIVNQHKVKCHVKLESQTMYAILQSVDIDDSIKSKIDFDPYNVNDIWAQKVLATIPESNVMIGGVEQGWSYDSLDGKGITSESKKHVHLVIVGMNDMATSLAINAAHILHFPNFVEGDFSTCSHITFIDNEASKKGKEFRRRFHTMFDLARWRSCLGSQCLDDVNLWNDPMSDETSLSPYKDFLGDVNFMDVQWEFVEADVFDDEIVSYLESHAKNESEILTIVLCDENSEKNTTAVLGLREDVIISAHQILVRQNDSPITINLLRKKVGYESVKPFGIMSECYYGDVIHAEFGKLVNACYSDGKIDLLDSVKIDEAWEGMKVALKWSNIYCANMLFSKLRFLGLDTSVPISKEIIDDLVLQKESDIQRTEHYRWNTEKILMGYRPLLNESERSKWKSGGEKDLKVALCHLDILSNEDLKKIDNGVVAYDIKVNKKLSELYSIAIKKVNCSL